MSDQFASVDDATRAECVALVLKQLSLALVVSPTIAVVVWLSLRAEGIDRRLHWWLVSFAAMWVAQAVLLFMVRRPGASTERITAELCISSTTLAAVIAAAVQPALHTKDPRSSVLLVLIVASAVVTANVVATASVPLIFHTFNVTLFMLLGLQLFLSHRGFGPVLGTACMVLLVAVSMMGARLNELVREAVRGKLVQTQLACSLQLALARVDELATTDELTGLVNRRRFLELFEAEMASVRRHGPSSSVVVLDLDHFKTINDTFGHHVGDHALRIVAQAARSVLREIDVLARMGGEEFAVLAPDTDAAGAAALAERLRLAISRCFLDENPECHLTASFGVAALRPGATMSDLLIEADLALYQAKDQGRDRVVSATDLTARALE